MQNADIPIRDPSPALTPTAQRILNGAIQVLDRDGYRALTLDRIAQEAGENPALIRYYFGSKAGLISMLVDTFLYVAAVELIETLAAATAGHERRETMFRIHRNMARDASAYGMFYELVPNMLRDPGLRPKLRDLMHWYRSLDAWALAKGSVEEEAAELEPLALLTVAVLDGVGLQAQADAELDIEPAFALWERLVLDYLQNRDASAGRGSPT